MSWQIQSRGDSVSWLLEPGSPGVRYLALRDLVGLSTEDKELKSARRLAVIGSPVSVPRSVCLHFCFRSF